MSLLRFSNNAEAVLSSALDGNLEAPGARTIYIDRPEGWEDRFVRFGRRSDEGSYPDGADTQLATLTHSSLPGQYEVVAIVGHESGSDLFHVRREVEGAASAWPVGTLMQARITAKTLDSFLQCAPEEVPTLSDGLMHTPWEGFAFSGAPHIPRLAPMLDATAYLHAFGSGASVVGASVTVDLGEPPTIADADGYGTYAHGDVYLPPTPDGHQYSFYSLSGGPVPYAAPLPPLEFVGGADTIRVSGEDGSALGYFAPVGLPVDIAVPFLGRALVVEEVGFIADVATATTVPVVSIGDFNQQSVRNAVRFADAAPLTQITSGGQIHRVPAALGGGMSHSLTFRLDTPATGGSFRGRFYWRGFLVQD